MQDETRYPLLNSICYVQMIVPSFLLSRTALFLLLTLTGKVSKESLDFGLGDDLVLVFGQPRHQGIL